MRRPCEEGGEWKFVSIMLTDSSYSKKKTLAVNSTKVIDQEKIPNFGRPPYSLADHLESVPIAIVPSPYAAKQDYELMIAGTKFNDILKRYQ